MLEIESRASPMLSKYSALSCIPSPVYFFVKLLNQKMVQQVYMPATKQGKKVALAGAALFPGVM